MTSYVLSWLRKRFADADLASFVRQHPDPWIVWEPGRWHPPPREGSTTIASEVPSDPQDVGEALAVVLRGREPGAVTFGRGPENDVPLDDATLSRTHLAFLRAGDGRWTVRDAGSSNGSWVNRQKLEPGKPVPLASGAFIKAAGVRLTFYESGDLFLRLKGL